MSRFNSRHAAENLDELRSIGVSDNDRDIFELIMHLPSKYKIVLDLYYIENYSVWMDLKLMLLTLKILFTPDSTEGVDIAEITNVSPVAVRKRLQYGRKLLKAELERK